MSSNTGSSKNVSGSAKLKRREEKTGNAVQHARSENCSHAAGRHEVIIYTRERLSLPVQCQQQSAIDVQVHDRLSNRNKSNWWHE